MQFENTLESLSISTDNASIFGELSNIMTKNFASTLKSRGKVMSFYDEKELVQRRYFLKFLKKLALKHSKAEPDFKFAENKTLKLLYKAQNTLSEMLFVDVDFVGKDVIFTLNKTPKKFINYLIAIFKDASFRHTNKTNSISFKFSTSAEFEALSKLLNKKEHMQYSVSFNYNQQRLEKAKEQMQNSTSSKYARRFLALASLLEDEFDALGCDINADFTEVRESYLSLVKMYHPDRHMQKGQRIRDEYRKHFERVQKAYEALKPLFKQQDFYATA